MAEPEKRRRRPAVSCTLCRRRKQRCNREAPCSNCIRSKNNDCVYDNLTQLAPRPSRPSERLDLASGRRNLALTDSSVFTLARSSTQGSETHEPTSHSPWVTTPSSSIDVQSAMRSGSSQQVEPDYRATTVQRPVQPRHIPISTSHTESNTSSIGGTYYLHRDISSLNNPRSGITRSVVHKSRHFGQSHWITGLTLLLSAFDGDDPRLRDETSLVISTLQRCKILAALIKSQRTPAWPSPSITELPPVETTDKLVKCYMQTTESVFRVLHVPSFNKDYEAVKRPGFITNPSFLVLLKLVLAIGAVTYDEAFSLREPAIRWVYEAQTWIAEPEFKSRLGLQFFQINILLLIARELVAVGGHADSIWVSAGALLRRAMSMGLNRDPTQVHPEGTILVVEMHRRLWNTILEISLQSSLTSGGPPLISLDDFDTKPPGNFDDEQLLDDNPTARSESQFTDTSVSLALRRTFPLRLEVTRFLNRLNPSGTYEETLKHDSDLRESYKVAYKALQTYKSTAGSSPPPFATSTVDFIQNRYMSALHVPFFGLSFDGPAYAYSRKVVVDTSLKLWHATSLERATYIVSPPQTIDRPLSVDVDNNLARLISCGSGFYRTVAMQAALLLALELRAQAVESQSLGPMLPRQDLLEVVEDAKTWCVRCIDAGETNVKGYLIVCAVSAQVQGLLRGINNDDIAGLIVQASEDSLKTCIPILEHKAARGSPEELNPSGNPHEQGTPAIDDWDFLPSNTLFNAESTEPMAWMLDDDMAAPPTLW